MMKHADPEILIVKCTLEVLIIFSNNHLESCQLLGHMVFYKKIRLEKKLILSSCNFHKNISSVPEVDSSLTSRKRQQFSFFLLLH